MREYKHFCSYVTVRLKDNSESTAEFFKKRCRTRNLLQESSKRQKPRKAEYQLTEPKDKVRRPVAGKSDSKYENRSLEVLNSDHHACEIKLREGNRHLHADREGVSIVKRNSYTDAGCKAHIE
ncbi:hypothetical protein Tco_0953973 [Tanacetum coccineum]|uniref:Uncharacterized protein n=1 Tax=Tanacetum coccineum TaxID=301880 RepID=A0ABQ5E341_9ASTR